MVPGRVMSLGAIDRGGATPALDTWSERIPPGMRIRQLRAYTADNLYVGVGHQTPHAVPQLRRRCYDGLPCTAPPA